MNVYTQLNIKPNEVISKAACDMKLGKFLGAERRGSAIHFSYEKGMIAVSNGKISAYWLDDALSGDRVELSPEIVNLARAHNAGAFTALSIAMGGARQFEFERGTVFATDNWHIADMNGWKRGPKHFTVDRYEANPSR